MTIKQLKQAIESLPDDMRVAIDEVSNEATGMADNVSVINGANDENVPYDKGNNPYQLGVRFGGAAPKEKLLFIHSR
jgi:hypothetical protein